MSGWTLTRLSTLKVFRSTRASAAAASGNATPPHPPAAQPESRLIVGAAESALLVEQRELEEVRFAFRLGCAISELRGRYRPDLFRCPIPPDPGAVPQPHAFSGRDQHQLPLDSERGLGEIRIEIRHAIGGLAEALELELPALDTFAARLREFEADRRRDAASAWPAISELVYEIDAAIQDELLVPAAQAAAYQLGRALADTYWALDPKRNANEWGSWQFVLGDERCEAIKRTTLRLSSYLGASVVAAVHGPLSAWNAYAKQQPGGEIKIVDGIPTERVLPTLNKQGILWRDLVRGERLPQDLHEDTATPTAKDQDLWRRLSLYKTAVRPMIGPIAVALIAVLALLAGAWFLASGTQRPGLTTAITIAGALGLTSASLYAKAKAQAFGLLRNIQHAVSSERIREEANLLQTITPTKTSSPGIGR